MCSRDWSSDVCSSDLNCLVFMKFGGLNHLITNPRDMKGFVAELRKIPFTSITGVNTLFNGLLNTPGFDQVDFSHMHLRSEEHTSELQSRLHLVCRLLL